MCDKKEPLRYDEQTARIAAKWQLGLRDNVRLSTILFPIFMIVTELARYLAAGAVPAPAVLRTDMAVIVVFLFAAALLERKTKQTAERIRARALYVDFSNGAVVVSEDDAVIFNARYDAITAVDAGGAAVRLKTAYDAVCLPRAQVSEALLDELRERLGKTYRAHGWM